MNVYFRNEHKNKQFKMILHCEYEINNINNKFNQTIVKFVDVFELKKNYKIYLKFFTNQLRNFFINENKFNNICVH